MCDTGEPLDRFGFIVDVPPVRAIVGEAERVVRAHRSDPDRVAALAPAFARLLASDGWLPDTCATPDTKSGMGGGIGQYALYRADDGSLCLFTLVVPPGGETPVHDHLAWGIVGVYRGAQHETVYRRVDDGRDPAHADLVIAKQQRLARGECYALLPPADDIHYVRTTSEVASVSVHLLANDTACVWRHPFDPVTGIVTPFRSGYTNARCPTESAAAPA